MKVLITGATGLIGTYLSNLLVSHGIHINYFTTDKSKIKSLPSFQGFYWNPEQCIIDESAFIGVDAIIHLAGATIAKKWTSTYKQEILQSRVLSGNLLYKTLKENPHQVKQIIAASGISVYPSSFDENYNESFTDYADDFLGNVVEKWENSVRLFNKIGIETCYLRTGLVLAKESIPLQKLVKPISMGVGAAFGSGEQWQSWIHIEDVVKIYYFALTNKLSGIYNVVAPQPVTNKKFVKSIAQQLHKNIVLPNIPEFMVKPFVGEMASLLYHSQKVDASKIVSEGYKFRFIEVEDAIKDLLSN